MPVTTEKVFSRERFSTQKEWLYFALEYDLEICWGCRAQARRRPPPSSKPLEAWYCPSCPDPVHGALWEAIRTGRDTEVTCELCADSVPLRNCWISDDCLRLYCAHHLEPLRIRDRLRFTVDFLRSERGGEKIDAPRSDRLKAHLERADCGSCAFNGRGIYAGDRLVEVDRGDRRCDCAPDALNCAGIEH